MHYLYSITTMFSHHQDGDAHSAEAGVRADVRANAKANATRNLAVSHNGSFKPWMAGVPRVYQHIVA